MVVFVALSSVIDAEATITVCIWINYIISNLHILYDPDGEHSSEKEKAGSKILSNNN